LTVDTYGNAYVVGQQKKGESGWDAIAAKYTPAGLRRWTSGALTVKAAR
jgi:hypothetical protein